MDALVYQDGFEVLGPIEVLGTALSANTYYVVGNTPFMVPIAFVLLTAEFTAPECPPATTTTTTAATTTATSPSSPPSATPSASTDPNRNPDAAPSKLSVAG